MNQVDSKRILWSWAMYDFANSAFTTLVVTLFMEHILQKALLLMKY